MIADIATGHSAAADVLLLAAVILAVLSAVGSFGTNPLTRHAGWLLSAAVAAAAFAWLLLQPLEVAAAELEPDTDTPTREWVAIILAVGLATALNMITFAALYTAISHTSDVGGGLSENATQILTTAFGGIIGVLGGFVGYRAGQASGRKQATTTVTDMSDTPDTPDPVDPDPVDPDDPDA